MTGTAHTTGRADTEGIAETEGTTHSTNWSRGGSTTDTVSRQHTEGRSQTLRSVFQVMPTQSYGLEELVHIASVRIANLDLGEAIVKIGKRPATRIRTLRIREGWARPEHVARVKQQLFETTPYIMRIAEARVLYVEQRKQLEVQLRPRLTDERRNPPDDIEGDWG
jgi:hypothetical protein